MTAKNVVLFYPRLGWMDTFVLDLPLSIVYLAQECRRAGIEVRMLDQRVEGGQWRRKLDELIDANTVIVGFSCMTGAPITHALEATYHVKEHASHVTTVWGGHHATICPESTLAEPAIDYIIRGHGGEPLLALVEWLADGKGHRSDIAGLGWRVGREYQLNPMNCETSLTGLAELSCEGLTMSRYTRFNYDQRVYSLFTAFGCPHDCTFCYAPIFYREARRRWSPYEADDVVAHIEKVSKELGVQYISLLDENFFMDRERARSIFEGILASGVQVEWGIRGARIDDLDRLDGDFLELMQRVGVRQMMIGAESGSPRMLKIMKKGITPEQIIRVNAKLARFPALVPSYNFLSGLPGETVEDIFQSVDLILRLMADNPNASFSGMNQFMPFPGSELYDQCREGGFEEPKTLEGWTFVDTHFTSGRVPWLDPEVQDTLKAVQVSLMFADDKIERELGGPRGATASRGFLLDRVFALIRILAVGYRPVARFRLKKRFFSFAIEYHVYYVASRLMGKVVNLKRR